MNSSIFKNQKTGILIFGLLVFCFTALYLTQVLCNHYFFRTYAFDYGLYNNAIWDYSHFRINHNSVFTPPLKNFLQDHIAYTLFLILPIFWILNPLFGTSTLLVIEVLFIVLGGIGCYKFIKYKTNNQWIALLALFNYYILQGHFATLSGDYHDVVIGASMITWFIYFFTKENLIATVLSFLFIVVSKENMPLWISSVIVGLMIINYKNRKLFRLGAVLFVVSIIYFVVAFFVLIPYYEDPARPHWAFYYKLFGSTPKEVFYYFLTHPFETFAKMFYNHTTEASGNFVKLEYYVVFLLCGAWILFRRPVLFLFILPVLAQKMLMDQPGKWSLNSYFSIEIESVFTLCVFFVIASFKKPKTMYIIAIIVTVLCTITSINTLKERNYTWYDEEKENIFAKSMYKSQYNIATMREGLQLIPDNVAVSASDKIVSHLAYRSKIYVYPEVRDAQYVVLFEGNSFPLKNEELKVVIDQYINNQAWLCIHKKSPLFIFKKK